MRCGWLCCMGGAWGGPQLLLLVRLRRWPYAAFVQRFLRFLVMTTALDASPNQRTPLVQRTQSVHPRTHARTA
jgi:hypothetical protein